MKQQIVVSGIGGQGVLFLTRVIAQAAVGMGLPVLTAESHGMAQRGGSVLSTLKVGDFHSPLIRAGQGDAGLFLWDRNLPVHQPLLRPGALLAVNRPEGTDSIDASGIARGLGSAVLSNLVLLGFAVAKGGLFCDADAVESAIRELSPGKFVEQNLGAFREGMKV